jgi:hypothetical protein
MDDDELVAQLRRVAAQVDPVPGTVVTAARAALSTRDLDGELAVLLADSATESEPGLLEPVRTAPSHGYPTRLLTFGGGGVQIDLEVGGAGGQLELLGQVTGAAPGECAIQHAYAGWTRVDLDSLGRFLFSGLRHGPVRVRCRSAGGIPVTTSWVTV